MNKKLLAVQRKDHDKITYKPIRGGKLKCNQTGEVIKSLFAKKHRIIETNKLLTKSDRRTTVNSLTTIELKDISDSEYCPKCRVLLNIQKFGIIKCTKCNCHLNVKRYQKVEPIFNDGEARCIFCSTWNVVTSHGSHPIKKTQIECSGCNKYFFVERK